MREDRLIALVAVVAMALGALGMARFLLALIFGWGLIVPLILILSSLIALLIVSIVLGEK